MQITVDRQRCESHEICAERSPQLFTIDDDGELIAHHEGENLPPSLEVDAAFSVAVCPRKLSGNR